MLDRRRTLEELRARRTQQPVIAHDLLSICCEGALIGFGDCAYVSGDKREPRLATIIARATDRETIVRHIRNQTRVVYYYRRVLKPRAFPVSHEDGSADNRDR